MEEKRIENTRCTSAWLLAALLGVTGCCPKTSDSPESGERTLAPAAGQALVQVLFYGLMAFEHDDSGASPRIWVLMPNANDHKRELHYGKYLGLSGWKWERVQQTWSNTLRIEFDPPLNPPVPLSMPPHRENDWLPETRKGARDARWRLHAKEIAGEDLTVDRKGSKLTMLFDSGEFETCGLVHAAQIDNICQVNSGNARRAMSEYMVLRWTIPPTTRVFVRDGTNEFEIPATGDTDGNHVARYDLAVTNLGKRDVRENTTEHLEDLRAALFPMAIGDWKGVSYGAPCKPGVQATCITRYQGWSGSPSGSDRPLCPFVAGGP